MTNNSTCKNITLFQWNCHGILNKRDSLAQLGNQFDILAISETWLSPDKSFHLNNYNILRKDGPSSKSGGVLLAIRNSISFTKLDSIFSSDGVLEAVGARISSSQYDIHILSIYRHPCNSSLPIWEELFNSIPTSGQMIITGDFNAHHTSWGCNRSDPTGTSLFNSSQDFSFFPLNDGSPTFISYSIHSSSVIDLTFVSPDLAPYCSWNSYDDSLGSDHIPSIVTIDHPIQTRSFFTHKLRTSKINKKLLLTSFSRSFPLLSAQLASGISPIEKYFIFCNFLKDIVVSLLSEQKVATNSSSCKDRRSNNPDNRALSSSFAYPPAPWWNEQCSEAIENRKQALRTFRRNPSRLNYINLKKQEAIARKTLRHAKRTGWRSFCESITSSTSISALWRIIKRFKNRFLNTSTSHPSSNSGIPAEIQEQINSISPSSCLHKLPPSYFDSNRSYSCHIFDDPFRLEELLLVISSFKNKKSSPGLDQIDYAILSNLPKEYYPILLSILNDLFLSGDFPETWSHSLVFFIPKAASKKFRPISLTSCCLKILEKLILLRLDWWVERFEKLQSSQFGFRKFRSCQDNLSILTTEIHTSFTRGTSTACLFLDLSNAFDDVIPSILISDLMDMGLSPFYVDLSIRLFTPANSNS